MLVITILENSFRDHWTCGIGIFQLFVNFWVKKLEPSSGKAKHFENQIIAWIFLENAFQLLFDRSRECLLELLKMLNVFI